MEQEVRCVECNRRLISKRYRYCGSCWFNIIAPVNKMVGNEQEMFAWSIRTPVTRITNNQQNGILWSSETTLEEKIRIIEQENRKINMEYMQQIVCTNEKKTIT